MKKTVLILAACLALGLGFGSGYLLDYWSIGPGFMAGVNFSIFVVCLGVVISRRWRR